MTSLRAVAALVLLGLGGLLQNVLPGDTPPLPPGVPPKVPAEQAKNTFQVAKGLDIQLLAHEPMVRQPVCITFDDRGRLWVLQYLQFPIPKGLKPVEVDQYLRTKYDRVPEPPPKGPKGGDKIIVLEDPDAEGRYRKAKDILTGLNLASGMALGYGGVFVVQSPYLLFYRLKPGADEPDGDPEVLLKGFGMEDAHAFANSLTWGPDGWLYGAQGSTVTANIRGIEFQQGIWRYHPKTREFELFAEGGGNTWGIDFDRHGQLFAGGNTTEPLCHHVQGGYYIKGFGKHGPLHNPYSFGYFDPVKHRGFLGSALTGGFVIYQGGLFPERFTDVVIYPNLRVNAMRVSRLEPAGSTFTTTFQEDFLTSSDRWFRPVKGLVGPDGALTVADWYDYNISHTDPKDRSKWYQPSRDTGRIWCVAPQGVKRRADGKWPLGKLSNDDLVDLLKHPNAWYSREARRILMERRDPAICPRLTEMVLHEKDGKLALEALWALYVSGGFTDELALKFLDHPFEHVRAWTIRLLGDRRQVARRFNDRLVELARREPSATVRSQLACTCKRLPGPVALPIVEQMLGRAEDVADPHIPLLLWWAVEDKAISDRDRVLKLVGSAEAWNRPIARAVVVERLARRYLAEGGPEGFASCARLLGLSPTPAERERLVRALEQQMEGLHLDTAPEALASALRLLLAEAHPSSALVRLSLRLGLGTAYPLASARAADARRGAEERADFIRTLGELKRPTSLAALLPLLGAKEPAQVRAAALLAVQRYETPEIAIAVIEQYPQMTPVLRDKARDVLVSRSSWSAAALTAVEKGSIPAKDFSLEQVRRVVLHKDAKLNERVEKLWGQVRPATSREKRGRIMAVSQILGKGAGDAGRGKLLVVKHCLNCHQLFNEGAKIGPDLTAVDRKNLEVLLPNVIDPSAVIREGYQQFIVATVDGRVLSGLLAENTPEKTTVLDAKGVRIALRKKDIESLTRADTSLMPEGILDGLSDRELRDLFAYLRSEPSKTSWDGRSDRNVVSVSHKVPDTVSTVRGRDLHVDSVGGDDAHDGQKKPVRTIARAIRLAGPGDTIHLKPMIYRDWAAFYDKVGEPGRPLTLDGHGATLDGCDPLDPAAWKQVAPGLFRHDDLLPLTDAIIDRWFFLWNGKMNRMCRCSKGPCEPLKSPDKLQPGEWTFVKAADRKAARGCIHGSFFLRLPAGQTLAEARIQAPLRPAGVLMTGKCRHLIVRNLTAIHPYNDGFNLSDCQDVVFQNIRALDCGDDGISAHGDCRYRVDGFHSIGNATGICDTGSSETRYRRALIRDCIGFDLFFLNTGRYSIADSTVISSAAKAVFLQGSDKPAPPCCLTLDNVLIRRQGGASEVRVSANCRLTARRTTFLNLDFQTTGGEVDLDHCFLGGSVPAKTPRKPDVHIWKDATWRGRANWYDVGSIRWDRDFFYAATFDTFRQLTTSDRDSHLAPAPGGGTPGEGIGADANRIPLR